MVVGTTMARRNVASLCHQILFPHRRDKASPTTLGILAFDAAKTMCRLVSLYKSLTDDEVDRLRNDVMTSPGVAYLNSDNECFLLNLACAEHLEELNLTAISVSRLSRRCSNVSLQRFDLVYADLKLGVIDTDKLEFKAKNIQKILEKMEKLVSSTGNLQSAMEGLNEMEVSRSSRLRRLQTLEVAKHGAVKPNMEYFNERMKNQRKQVQHFKEVSLWSQTFDKVVSLMAKIVCIVYVRIFSIFGPHVADMQCMRQHDEFYQTNRWLFDDNEEAMLMHESNSSPSLKPSKMWLFRSPKSPISPKSPPSGHRAGGVTVNSNREIVRGKNNRVFNMAAPSTVGGSGLSLRYANVILFAERCLRTPATIGEDARVSLYEMLPERVRDKVMRVRRRSRKKEGEGKVEKGWREVVEKMMEWLLPVAQDTVRWQAERNLEKQRLDTKPTALLMQTLHYSDLEKAEAAIVEVLVGLSCIYSYEQFRSFSDAKCMR